MRAPVEAPQADRLDLVRRVVEAVRGGAKTSPEIAVEVQLAPRYALYALQAARLLELIAEDPAGQPEATPMGERLVATPRGSAAERSLLREAFTQCKSFTGLVEAVLGPDLPSKIHLADLLVQAQKVAVSTALRRATTLLAWRRYLMPQDEGPQLRFAALDWSDEPDFVPPPVQEVPSAAPVSQPSDPHDIIEIAAAAVSDHLLEEPVSQWLDALPDVIVPHRLDEDTAVPEARAVQESVPIVEEAASPTEPLIRDDHLAYLRRQASSGSLVLLTGAGFSLGALDVRGLPLPTGDGFARELWQTCYPGEEFDRSSLQDVFEHAQRRHRQALDEILGRRFSVDSGSLPEWYCTWFSFPWWKIYTLNVDNLESAANRRFDLPRPLKAVSAASGTVGMASSHIGVVHLNGLGTDGADKVTFSTDQFAKRLARPEPIYAQLAAEILTRPFVFVGSPLDEPLFWQHIALRGMRESDSENELRPKGFLVSPHLTRARVDKLRAFNIVWIKATAQQFAERVLDGLKEEAVRGRAELAAATAADSGDESNIVEVANAVLETGRRTAFLLGEEPSWADIRTGRGIERDEDRPRIQRLRQQAIGDRKEGQRVPIAAIMATAGAGKTTLLMKVAVQLHADGIRVAWIGANADVAPRALIRFFRSEGRPPVLVIDDAGRYGTQLVPILRDLQKEDGLRMIVMALRSYHEHLLEGPGETDLALNRQQIGRLTDPDIDRLLAALEHEKRLGELRGKSIEQRRAAFRDRADRQILVAMIEATSGEKFEDKVISEWAGQDPVARYVYALVALATEEGLPLSRDEVLLACGGGTKEMDALKRLHKAHLLSEDESQRYRVRHRVIAEMLVEELSDRGTQLEQLVIGLCRALAIKNSSDEPRGSRRRRALRHLLNHDVLVRLLRDVEPARNVYAQLETHLDPDYHFWLQRGCLELECGDVRFAQNFLQQAAAINPSDPLVETAMAHMQLRRAVTNPAGPGGDDLVDGALVTLRRIIQARESTDYHPAHIFGSQVLAWCRRAALAPRARNTLLREAKEIVARAVGLHRTRHELRQLLADLTKEELQPH